MNNLDLLKIRENSIVDNIFKDCIIPGYEKYEEIINELPDDSYLYLCPYAGTGDVYLSCMYMNAYANKQNHKNFCVVVVGKANYKVAMLFKFQYIVSISQVEADCLVRLSMVLGKDDEHIKIMHHDAPQLHTGILENLRNINEINFNDLYLNNVFQLQLKDRQMPHFNYDTVDIENVFDKYNLKKGKTVVISPYANTLPPLPEWVWVNLADKLFDKGYCVCTNVGTPTEKAIKGTIPLKFEFAISVPLLEQCGYFIGIRSGLCDIVSSAKCKKIIVYQPYLFWGAGDNLDYFSLNKIKLCNDAIEMQHHGVEFLELIDNILENF
jgi:hypothetical protein